MRRSGLGWAKRAGEGGWEEVRIVGRGWEGELGLECKMKSKKEKRKNLFKI